MTRGLFPWKRRSRFHGKRFGASAARRVFFRGRGPRKNGFEFISRRRRETLPRGSLRLGPQIRQVVEENGLSVTLEAAAGRFWDFVI